MSISTDGKSVYANINDIPEIDEISAGDLILVETEDGTRLIDFQNFIIGPDNATFAENTYQTDIDALSANAIALDTLLEETNDYLNKKMTVGYYLAGTSAGPSFTSAESLQPVNYIQSNTIDNNFQNANSTLCGITSGSDAINLNTGTYHVQLDAVYSDDVIIDLYDATSSRVLLVSDVTHTPSLDGTVSFSARSSLQIRGYTSVSATLGKPASFAAANMVRTPLKATFTYLSSGVANFVRPDTRS